MKWDKVAELWAGLIGAVWGLFGGKDTMLMVLFAFLMIDFGTGLVVGAMGRSGKTETGYITSTAARDGAMKKLGELVAVIVGVLLDALVVKQLGLAPEMAVFRSGVMLYIIATEGISIVENLGKIGVPWPAFVRQALEQLRKQADNAGSQVVTVPAENQDIDSKEERELAALIMKLRAENEEHRDQAP